MNKNITNTKGKIDWMITLVPLGIVIELCILFFLLPDQSNAVLLRSMETLNTEAVKMLKLLGNETVTSSSSFFFSIFASRFRIVSSFSSD